MSWHSAGLLIRVQGDHTPADWIEALGFGKLVAGESVSLDEALSFRDAGLLCAESNGWLFVIDPMMFFGDESDDIAESTGLLPNRLEVKVEEQSLDVCGFMLEGTSGTYGFAFYQAGKRQRIWLVQEDAVLIDEGEPSPSELADREVYPDDEEQFVLSIVQQLTVDLGQFKDSRFTVFQLD